MCGGGGGRTGLSEDDRDKTRVGLTVTLDVVSNLFSLPRARIFCDVLSLSSSILGLLKENF